MQSKEKKKDSKHDRYSFCLFARSSQIYSIFLSFVFGLCTIFVYRNDGRHTDSMCVLFYSRKKNASGSWCYVLCYSQCLTVCLLLKHSALHFNLNFLFLRLLLVMLTYSIVFFYRVCCCCSIDSFLVSLMSTVQYCAWKTHIFFERKLLWKYEQ